MDFKNSDIEEKNDLTSFDETGVVYRIATENGLKLWNDPALSGKIKVEFSSIGVYSDPAYLLFDKSCYCSTKSEKNSWIIIDFGDIYTKPIRYSLRNAKSKLSLYNESALRSWKLEGSNGNAQPWKTLAIHANDLSLHKGGDTATWI